MKILYDGYAYSLQKYGGITRVFTEVIDRIENLSPDIEVCKFRIPKKNETLSNLYFLPKVGGLLRKADHFLLQKKLNRFQPDIYHPTYYRLVNPGRSRLVVSVYDLIHEKFLGSDPGTKFVIAEKKKCIERADVILAISESTKNDLVQTYGISKEKIKVVYLAASESFSVGSSPVDQQIIPHGLPSDYLLYVGSRSGYKNFELLFHAFEILNQKQPLNMVCAGGGAWSSSEMALINNSKYGTRTFNYQGLTDTALRCIYSKAKMFIYPSLYEGFGIPLLEAMVCGTPIISANSSSLPEVGGDAVEYFDPTSVDDLVSKIELLVQNAERRRQLSERGFKQVKQFDWQKTAEKTYEVYQSII